MAKAVRFHRLGGPEVLQFEEVSVPDPGPGEVKLKIEAVGLNRAESGYFHGRYMEQPQLPSRLGYEAVGVVEAVGPDVEKKLLSQRFGTIPGFSMNKYGVLAEEAIVPAHVLAATPARLSLAEGAAVWMQYVTAYGALVLFGKVGNGDFVIIPAASSSVGLAAIQIVKAEGGTAIAATRTSAKRDELLKLGADHVIATQEEDLPERVAEITGGQGARIVFDPVGGEYVETLAEATAEQGTIYLYGTLSGEPTTYPMMAGFRKGVGLRGYSLMSLWTVPERMDAAKKYIYERLEDGRFQPKIARTFSFAETRNAYEYLESNQQVGKIVITV